MTEYGNASPEALIRAATARMDADQRVATLKRLLNDALLDQHHAAHDRAVDAARTVA